MNSNDPLEAAIDWTIRLKEGSAEDWRAFTAWLEADPAHAAVYDEVSRADATLGQLSPRPRPVMPPIWKIAPPAMMSGKNPGGHRASRSPSRLRRRPRRLLRLPEAMSPISGRILCSRSTRSRCAWNT